MSYTQTLHDDFADNSINATKWPTTVTGVTETSGKMHVAALSSYPHAHGQNNQNLANGIWAVKFAKSGTATAETEFYIGAHDGAGNHVTLFSSPINATLGIETFGSATHSSDVITDTTVGLGSSWTANDWLGCGNMGADNILRFYKSSDGQTWTELARTTVGGTFTKATSGISMLAGVWSGSSTWVADVDDASFWTNNGTGTNPKVKVRVGGSWVSLTANTKVKVRVGGAWVTAKPKKRVGGAWIAP